MKRTTLNLIGIVAFVISCVTIQSRADWQYNIDHDPFVIDTFDPNSTNTPPEPPVTLFALSASATDVSSEIKALSGALKHDLIPIYNYVRNNIEWSALYGVRNGANGCLQAGKGSDADQACLLSSLLTESGYDVRLRKGLVFYEIDDLTDWYGVDSKALLTNAVGRSGNYIYDWPAHPTWWGIFRVWTEVDINGTWYKLDPAYTKYDDHSAIDLEDACGFDMSTFMSSALTGASYDSNYVQNVSSGAIVTKLELYCSTLKSYIETNMPNASLAKVLGGRTRRIETMTALSTSLPEAKHTDWVSNWVPANESAQVNIQHMGINETVSGYQIAGKRISITYDTANSYRPVLLIGGDLIATGTATTPGTKYNLYVSVNHPYLSEDVFNCDQTYTLKPQSGNTYLLAHNFSSASKQSAASASRQLGSYFIDELPSSGEPILGESMYNVMESGLTQWMGTQDVLAELCDRNVYPYHFLGLMKVASNGSYYVDLSAILALTVPRADTSLDSAVWEHAFSLGVSGLEHSILEQSQGADNPAVSTVKLLKISNTASSKTFLANSGNWSTGYNVKSRLLNYSAALLSDIETAIGQGDNYVLPQNANINLSDWTGIGYIRYGNTGYGLIIEGGLNGGENANSSSSYSSVTVNNVTHIVSSPPPAAQVNITASADPVDLFSGSLLFDSIDLSLGNGGVHGLSFSRHYNSSQRAVSGTLGNGWRHSYDITATEISDASVRFGTRQIVDTIPTIVQNYVNSQLMNGSPKAKEWVASSIVTQWGTDQLVDNAVHIRLGNRSLEYVLQPDGIYIPPAGVTTELSKTNDSYRLTERFGEIYQFNANGTIGSIEDADGNTMEFSYNSKTNLQTVTDCYDRTLTFAYNTEDRINKVTDSTGREVQYSYTSGDLDSSRDADSNWTDYIYDDQHQLVSITDPLSQMTASNIYNDIGQVVTQYNAYGEAWDFHCGGVAGAEIDPSNNQLTHYFDNAGRNIGTEDAMGNRTYKQYDVQGQVITNINANTENTVFQYDTNHNLTNRIDALGNEWIYEYDSAHHLIAETDPLGNTTRYQYDSEHHLTSVSNQLGQTTTTYTTEGLPHIVTATGVGLSSARTVTYTYDSYGNPETNARTDGGTITNTYNARGELIIARDANGNQTTYTYNNRGLVTSVTDDDGNTVSNVYNDAGYKTAVTDKRDNTTTYTYTPTYKIETVTYPDSSVTSNSYDSVDRLIATTDGEGNTITFTYDQAGRRTAVTDDLDHSNHYALDPNGNILAVTNAIDNVTRNTVDALNRITNSWDTVDSQIRRVKSEFDTAGRQITIINPLDQRTEYEHDALGRVTATTRPDQASEHNQYDALGNLLSYTNAKETAIVSTTYDGQSRPLTQTNALGNGKSWTYDNAGNQLTRTDANGDTIQYAFDNLNRIESIQYPDSTGAGFSYDENSNLLTATNSDADLSFVYDTMNRITAVTQSVLSESSVVQYSYNNNGQRTGLTYPDSETASYTYDDANRLTALSSTLFTSNFAFSYNDANQLTGITYPNGVTATYTRDTGGRLTGIKYAKGATTHIDRTYEYNALGQITKRSISAGLEAVPSDTHRYMKHNAADQLTHVSRMDNYENPEQWRDVGPHYDPNGSTTNMAVKYNGMNLTSTFNWDYNGQLTSYNGEHQTNLWFTVPPLPKSLSWKYDALGNRISRTDADGEKIHILDHAAKLKNILVQTSTNGTIERYYIYAPGFGLVAHVEANGTVCFYHGDHLGSTIALTDSNGNLTDQFAYTPYGELMTRTGTTETSYTFCGRHGVYWEGGALYHMKARYYRADTARFISSDPIGISGGVNLYAYANGNPIQLLDALGLCASSYYDDPGYPALVAAPSSSQTWNQPSAQSIRETALQIKEHNSWELQLTQVNPGYNPMFLPMSSEQEAALNLSPHPITNPSGHGYIMPSTEVSAYFGPGVVGGSQVIRLDSGEVVSYGYGGAGAGTSPGYSVQIGEVNGVYNSADYEGWFIDMSGAVFGASGSHSEGPGGGTSSTTFGVGSPGASISLQYYFIINSSEDSQ